MKDMQLRAYFMLRSNDGDWTVKVCRSLQEILDAWKNREITKYKVAVLHIGFERPPSHRFDDLTVKFPSHVLLTSAAKYVLPNSFTTSKNPVGNSDNLPIFLGLEGWGYSMDDPSVVHICSNDSEDSTPNQEPQGWVALFVKENPNTSNILVWHGIFDEISYLNAELSLDRSLRQEMGNFRLKSLLGTNCNSDPCKFAQAAPPWLNEQYLSDLGITVRIANVFRSANIQTVADLASWSSSELLSLPNFGRTSLRETMEVLSKALDSGPKFETSSSSKHQPTNRLLFDIRQSLSILSERERHILSSRLGFETNQKTLQQVADECHLTRERVRQMERHSTRKLLERSLWRDILLSKIEKLSIGRDYPLPVAGVEAIDPWFENLSHHLDFARNMVKTFFNNQLYILEIDGILYFSFINQAEWEQVISDTTATFSSAIGQNWTERYARSLVQNLLPENAREFNSFLWEKATEYCHFSALSNGEKKLIGFGRGAEESVRTILVESDSPLHYTEIAKRVSLKLGKTLEARRAHQAAANIGLLFGRGIYGLSRHLPLSNEEMMNLINEIEGIVCAESLNKQWHTNELLSILAEREIGNIDKLNKYLLDIVLAESTVLKSLGRMIWAHVSAVDDDATRINLHQAVVSLVKDAGHPLTTNEIIQKLTRIRGVSEHFQIFPNDPLIRLRPGVWGIKDRDAPLASN